MVKPTLLAFVQSHKSAKIRFKFRGPINALIVFGAFLLLWAIFFPFCGWFLASCFSAGILFFPYFYVLDKRPIGMRCPRCGSYLETNTPWVCGFNKCKNESADDFPFVHRCEHCKIEPKAYKCHHCGEIIFLTEDRLAIGYAYFLHSPMEIGRLDEKTTREKEKENKAHALAMADMDEKLKIIQDRVQGPKVKSPREETAKVFDRQYEGIMGAHEYARKKRAEVKILYKDDPVALKEALDAIDEIEKRLI